MLIQSHTQVPQSHAFTAPAKVSIPFEEGTWSVQDAWDGTKTKELTTGLDELSRDQSYTGKIVKAQYSYSKDILSQPLSPEQRLQNARKEGLMSGLAGAVAGGVAGALGATVLAGIADLGSALGGNSSSLAPLFALVTVAGAAMGGIVAGNDGYTKAASREFAQEQTSVEGLAHVLNQGVLFCSDGMEPVYFQDKVNYPLTGR